jgi:anti-sigma B factor antagonist
MEIESHQAAGKDGLGSVAAVTLSTEGPDTVVKLSGEVDISNIDAVRELVEPVADPPAPRVVFDLSELRLIDSTGISLLLWTAQKVGSVQIRNPSSIVTRVIEITGLSTVLPTEE